MALEVGVKAPELNAPNQNGETITLDSLKGKKVVLYFYPKDNTPGCTAESCNLKDNYDILLKKGYEVIGVSADTQAKHQNFIAKFNLPFDLLADTEHTILTAYDVWKEKNTFGKTYMGIVRTTYIIDENGIIEEVISKVNTKNHTDQIIK